jgi:hypothetical protein
MLAERSFHVTTEVADGRDANWFVVATPLRGVPDGRVGALRRPDAAARRPYLTDPKSHASPSDRAQDSNQSFRKTPC